MSKSHNFLGSRFSKLPYFPTLLIVLKSGFHAPKSGSERRDLEVYGRLYFQDRILSVKRTYFHGGFRGSRPKIDFNLLNSGPSKSPHIVSKGSFGDIIGISVTVGSGTFALFQGFQVKIFDSEKIVKIIRCQKFDGFSQKWYFRKFFLNPWQQRIAPNIVNFEKIAFL